MRVLIAEDSKINLIIAKDTLSHYNLICDIITATDGEEALKIIKDGDVQLVLLDIVMPKKNGIEVLMELKGLSLADKPEVIMLTSIGDAKVLKECFDLGAVDYIQKPFEPMNFIARVRSTMREIEYKQEIKKTALLLEEQNKQLKEAQFYMVQKEKLIAIGELAAGIAHEINNPLAYVSSNFINIKQYATQIKSFFDHLKNEAVFLENKDVNERIETLWNVNDIEFILEDFPELVSETTKGIERMAKIVMGMRNFARVTDDDVFESVDMIHLLEEVLMIVNNEVKYYAEVVKDYGECPHVYCNKGEIEQVFVNLIMNASQAIRAKDENQMGTIDIKVYWADPYVCISVCDTGTGIRNEALNKIFDPFFTTKPVGHGTGLGLSISHSIIVEKHQGKIEVDSEPDRGTCFIVYLPAKQF